MVRSPVEDSVVGETEGDEYVALEGTEDTEEERGNKKRGREQDDLDVVDEETEMDAEPERDGRGEGSGLDRDRDRDSDRDMEKDRDVDKDVDRDVDRDRDRERDDGRDWDRDRRRDDSWRPEKRANTGSQDFSNAESSLRFLVPNSLAGAVIGKGGAVISEFQSQSGAKIVLSRTQEFFPGSSDRILMLNGTVNTILAALRLVLSKLDEEARSKGSPGREGDRVLDLKLVVPNRVCGGLIGKGGANIRSLGEDSGAQIKVSSQNTSQGAVGERLITVMGALQQQLRAVSLILTKAAEDPSYLSYADVPLSYTASGGTTAYTPTRSLGHHPGNSSTARPPSAPPKSSPLLSGQPDKTTIIVAVPDEHVGAVVGKGGSSLRDITQQSGARIEVSPRGDYIEGTSNRKVTITGPAECVVSAQRIIAEKVKTSLRFSQPGSGQGDHDRGPGLEEREEGRGLSRDRDGDRERDRDGERSRDRDRDRDRDVDRDRERYRDRDVDKDRDRERDRYRDDRGWGRRERGRY